MKKIKSIIKNKDKYTIQEKILFIIVASIAVLIFTPFSVIFFLILAGILILLGPIGWALLAMLCTFIYSIIKENSDGLL
jgi:hypothetical protein|nr:MAG TPA: hypothetical protein [Caudoviricetes sp.]